MGIHVIATSIEGTRAALTAAKPLAQQSGLPVMLLLSKRPDGRDANWLVARYEEVARDVGQPVKVRVCVCWNAADAATLLSPAGGTVFVGGPAGRFWPSAEERLAARLRRTGRDVVFAGCHRGKRHA